MSSFAPWRRNFACGALLLLAAAACVWAAVQQLPERLWGLVAGLLLAAIGIGLIRRGRTRRYGKTTERDAIDDLGELPGGWSVEANRPLPYGGDLDLYLVGPDGVGYAIEIKAFRDLLVERRFFGLRQRLLAADGRPLERDPLAQTIRNAQYLEAVPILWLPRAQGRTERLADGVVLVRGNAAQLKRALGIRWWWPW